MSKKDLARILGRALVDQDYAVLLSAEPDRAIGQFGAKLTANERSALDDFSPVQFRSGTEMLRSAAGTPEPPTDPDPEPPRPVMAEALNPSMEEEDVMANEAQLSTRLKALEDRVALLDQQQQQHGSALANNPAAVASRLKALEDRVALLDQQQQQHGSALANNPAAVASRLKALEDRVALLDQQQQQHGSALASSPAAVATRMKALEDRLAVLDQQQQQGHLVG